MDKRLAKRHKREVTRARERVKLSEPDVRPPEEIKTAREASRATRGGSSNDNAARNSTPSFRNNIQGTGSAAKTDG